MVEWRGDCGDEYTSEGGVAWKCELGKTCLMVEVKSDLWVREYDSPRIWVSGFEA